MSKAAPFTILPTDVRWKRSFDSGDPGCLCSRCGKQIEEKTLPIRAWPADASFEYTFHPKCLGFSDEIEMSEDP